MNLYRLVHFYRRWWLVCLFTVISSLYVLNIRLNQLAAEDTGDLGVRSEFVHDLRAPHLRSIRNYEQRPPGSFKILQVLQHSEDNEDETMNEGKPESQIPKTSGSDNILRYIPQQNSFVLDSETKDEESDDVDEEDEIDDAEDNNSNNSDENPNSVFQPGDFPDTKGFQKPRFKYEEIKHPLKLSKGDVATDQSEHRNTMEMQARKKADNLIKHLIPSKLEKVKNTESEADLTSVNSTIINGPYTDGIYWTHAAEDIIPTGKSDPEIVSLLTYVRSQPVKSLQPPEWYRCGRPLNGIVTLQDGSVMCARYRTPHNRFILGEVTSFHLSRLLGLDNVPPVVLTWVNGSQPQWLGVNFTRLHWQPNQAVALIDWVPHLNTKGSRVMIPPLIHTALVSKTPVTTSVLAGQRLSRAELSQLVQWGDLILFDYLTANYDRYASMQDAADKEKKPSILLERVRNLRQSSITGKLWLIDNESGLFDAYEQLYLERNNRFKRFHQEMLQTMCVFRRDLVSRIEKLAANMKPHEVLQEITRSSDRLVDSIKYDRSAVGYTLFQQHFKDRLQEVVRWIKHCASLNSA